MSPKRGLLTLLGVLIATLVTVVAPSANAAPHNAASTSSSNTSAAAAADPCAGKSQTYIVQTFIRGPEVFPLRCGTSTWGYIHLVASHDYDPSMIAVTVSQGAQLPLNVFQYQVPQCPPSWYRVVYNQGALNGTGVRPQGIITAYPTTTAASAAARQVAC